MPEEFCSIESCSSFCINNGRDGELRRKLFYPFVDYISCIYTHCLFSLSIDNNSLVIISQGKEYKKLIRRILKDNFHVSKFENLIGVSAYRQFLRLDAIRDQDCSSGSIYSISDLFSLMLALLINLPRPISFS